MWVNASPQCVVHRLVFRIDELTGIEECGAHCLHTCSILIRHILYQTSHLPYGSDAWVKPKTQPIGSKQNGWNVTIGVNRVCGERVKRTCILIKSNRSVKHQFWIVSPQRAKCTHRIKKMISRFADNVETDRAYQHRRKLWISVHSAQRMKRGTSNSYINK